MGWIVLSGFVTIDSRFFQLNSGLYAISTLYSLQLCLIHYEMICPISDRTDAIYPYSKFPLPYALQVEKCCQSSSAFWSYNCQSLQGSLTIKQFSISSSSQILKSV